MTETEKLIFALIYVRGLELEVGDNDSRPPYAVLEACQAVHNLRAQKSNLVLGDYREIVKEAIGPTEKR